MGPNFFFSRHFRHYSSFWASNEMEPRVSSEGGIVSNGYDIQDPFSIWIYLLGTLLILVLLLGIGKLYYAYYAWKSSCSHISGILDKNRGRLRSGSGQNVAGLSTIFEQYSYGYESEAEAYNDENAGMLSSDNSDSHDNVTSSKYGTYGTDEVL